jgi:hypothetical protein
LSNGYFISYRRGMVFISELPVPDARIFFCSARIPTGPSFNFWTIFYVEGTSSPIAGRDALNTYHSRKLADGTSHRAQNLPSTDDLIKTVDGIGKIRAISNRTITGFFSMNLLRRLERTLRFLAKTTK